MAKETDLDKDDVGKGLVSVNFAGAVEGLEDTLRSKDDLSDADKKSGASCCTGPNRCQFYQSRCH